MPLHIDLQRDAVTWSVETQSLFDRGVERLRKRIDRYGLKADHLTARFEPRRERVQARLELSLEGDAQTAMVVEDDADRAVRSAFDTLLHRFDAYAWHLDHARWEAPSGRGEVAPEPVVRYRQELLRFAMPALYRVAAHDIERLRDDELLPEDWLDPAEVVDAAIVERLPRIEVGLDLPKATLELVAGVREELLSRMTEIHEQQDTETSFETPMQQDVELDADEESDWPLDRATLNLSDVFQDPELLPIDELIGEKERRSQLVQALFELRDPHRPLFAQVVVDGWAEDTVAAAWNLTEDALRRTISEAAQQLSALLGVAPEEVVALYRALGDRLHEERRQQDLHLVGGGSS